MRHRREGRFARWRRLRRQRPERRRVLARMVDCVTGEIHLLLPDATRDGAGRFAALCGHPVLPASMADPGRSTCSGCIPRSEATV